MKISDSAAGPVVFVEWTFSPPNFFETQIAIARADYTMAIDAGFARARIEPSVFDARAGMRAELDAALRNRFEAHHVEFHAILTRHFHPILTHPYSSPAGSRCG